jgi:hypothetical protein
MTRRMPQEPFVILPRDLLRSDAWRSLGINERRLIDFLLLEHMRHAGKQNGNLKAPRQQLHAFGIGTHFVSAAIQSTEERGLIQCHRAGMRVATTYALTWLPTCDGVPPTHAWRRFQDTRLTPLSQPKIRNLAAKEQSGLGAKQQSDGSKLTAKEQSDGLESLGAKQQHPYRNLLPEKDDPRSMLGLRRAAAGGAR